MPGEQKETRRQANWKLIFRTGLSGIGSYLREAGRNAILHGHARTVSVTIRKNPLKQELFLEILDDGSGMNEEDRWRAGNAFGYSLCGSGTGFREAAITLAQYLEMHTVHREEPDTAWRITLPLIKFFKEIMEDQWRGQWEKIPRSESRIPHGQDSGTLVILSDFRAADPQDPFDTKRFQHKSSQVTEDNVRSHIEKAFPPDLAKLFLVNGKRVNPRSLEGYQLWREAGSAKPTIGIVSGEIRLSESGSGNWLSIGGTTATISFQEFVSQFADENPDVAKQIPRVFTRERRLTGLIRIGVLEQYPARDRMKLLQSFYTSPEALVAKDELVRIGDKVEEELRKYESLPRSEQTESGIAEFIVNMHEAQNVKPGTGVGGEREGTEGKDEPLAPLRVNPATAHLEPWTGRGERDNVSATVLNPLAGEEFEWDDQGVGILTDVQNVRAMLQAIAREGTFLIRVRSKRYQERERTISVVNRHSEDIRPSDDQFCLAPLSTQVVVGQERVIRIRQQGATSGKYDWHVEPEREGRKKVADLEVQPGGREVIFTAHKAEKYVITCSDRKNPSLVATSRIEALATRQDLDPVPPPSPPPGGTGGSGHDTVCGGTGDADAVRPSVLSGQMLHLQFRDKWYRFVIRSDATLKDPFMIEPEGKRIHIADARTPQEDPAQRLLHIAWCTAEGIQLVLMDEGALAPEDPVGCSELVGQILSMGLRKKKNGEAPH